MNDNTPPVSRHRHPLGERAHQRADYPTARHAAPERFEMVVLEPRADTNREEPEC